MSTDIIPNVSRSIRYTNDTRRHTHTHTAVQGICFVYLEGNGNPFTPLCVQEAHTHTDLSCDHLFVVTSTSPRRQTDLIDWEPVNELSVKQQANAEQAWTVSPAEGRWRQLGFLWRWCWRRIKVSRFSWTSSAADVSLVFLSLFTWSLSRFS